MNTLHIRMATEADIPTIRQIAGQTFPATYRGIISEQQIDFMMEWMYAEESLRGQMAAGHVFLLAQQADGTTLGYASVERQDADLFHLQKLYVVPSEQSAGVGRYLFQSVIDYVKTLHPDSCRLELNVNRTNPALGFYRRMGMHISREGDFPIGNGYYMNDYIMALQL